MYEPEVFWKPIYYIEEGTCAIVGTFRRPHSESTPGELRPLAPLVTPLTDSDEAMPGGYVVESARFLFLYCKTAKATGSPVSQLFITLFVFRCYGGPNLEGLAMSLQIHLPVIKQLTATSPWQPSRSYGMEEVVN